MNHVYRVVFNRSLGVYQCVSEHAKAQGKSSGRSAISGKLSSLIVSGLSIAILSTMTANIALATTYDNGNTQTVSGVYKPINDVITGSGTVLKTDSTLVGDFENGVLLIQESGKLKNADYMSVGSASGVSGQVTVTGNNSKLTTDVLGINKGSVTIEDGGATVVNNISISNESSAIVTGDDSKLVAQNMVMDNNSALRVSTGGRVNTDGYMSVSNSNLQVSDDGRLNTGQNMSVSDSNLQVSTGGRVNTGQRMSVSDSNLTVSTGGRVNTEGYMYVSNNSALTVSTGGKVNTDGWIYISDSALTVSTSGKVNADQNMYVDNNSSLTVSTGGRVDAGQNISVSDSNLQVSDDGRLNTGQNMSVSDSALTISNDGRVDTVQNMEIYNNSSLTVSTGGRVNTEGYMSVSNSNLQVSTGGRVNTGQRMSVSDSNLQVSTGGRVNTGQRMSVSDSNLTVSTGGRVNTEGYMSVSDSNLTVSTGGRVDTGQSMSVSDSALTVSTGGRVNTGQNMSVSDSALTVSTGGRVNTGQNMSVSDSALTVSTGGRVNTGQSMSVSDSALTVSTGGRVNTDQNMYVYNNSALTVSTGGRVNTGQSMYVSDSALTVSTGGKVDAGQKISISNSALTVSNGGQIHTNNIEKAGSALSGPAVVNLDNGNLILTGSPSPLFNDFTSSDSINLGAGGGTIDTNEFEVRVFHSAVIDGSGSFTKEGTGKLIMNNATKKWQGDTNIQHGTLQLDGNYNMKEGEVLGIGLDSPTDYGKLIVTETAKIAKGQLKINAADAIQNPEGNLVWKNVISAAELIGEFAAVTDNSRLVGFEADYDSPNAVSLRMVRQDKFVDIIDNQANRTGLSLAGVLDRSIDMRLANNTNELAAARIRSMDIRLANNTNELADALILSTIGFNQAQIAAAVNELQPLSMGATNRIITDTNYAVAEAVTERSLTIPNRGLWAKIIGSDSSHDEEGGVTGYDADSYGAIVGMDTPINENLSLGVAVSYIDSDVDSDSQNLNHKMSAKSWQVLGYGNYAVSDATQVNFHAGAGRSNIEGERYLSILTDAVAQSDYYVDTLQAGFGIGHRIGNELRNFTPFAQMSYARAESDSYRETGAGVYNFEVDENTYESMRWTAGIKMSQALTPKIALTGQLAAAIENGDQRSDITASFISMPEDKFTTVGQEIGQEIGIAGIGISYMPTANTTLSAGYRGEWRDNYNDQGVNVALRMTF